MGRYATSFFIVSLFGASSACGPSGASGAGESCYRSLECSPGLVCVDQVCTGDPSLLMGMTPTFEDAGVDDIPLVDADQDTGVDGGPADSGTDSGMDAGPIDAGPTDSGPMDAGPADAGMDSGPMDAGPVDAGMDSGPMDAGPMDSGPMDAGPMDSGPEDSGMDAG